MIPSTLPRPDLASGSPRSTEATHSSAENSFASFLEQRQPGSNSRPASASPRPHHAHSTPTSPRLANPQADHVPDETAASTDETEPRRHPHNRALASSEADASSAASELGYWLNALTATPTAPTVPPDPNPLSGGSSTTCPKTGAQESDTPSSTEAAAQSKPDPAATKSSPQPNDSAEPATVEISAEALGVPESADPLDTASEESSDKSDPSADQATPSAGLHKPAAKPLHLTGFSPSPDSSAADGMPFAKKLVAMKDPDISDQFAGGGEQNLPTCHPARIESAGPAPIQDGKPIPAATASGAPSIATPTAMVSAMDPSASSPASTAVAASARPHQGTSVEHIAHLLATEGALLRAHRAESLAVVIQPDAQTQLFLQLRQRNGEMEATVRCEKGDFQALNANWRELQESLARQDIRLAELRPSAGSSSPAASDRPSPQDQPANQGSRHHRPPAEDTEDLPMVGSVTEPLRRATPSRPRRSNKFESWA